MKSLFHLLIAIITCAIFSHSARAQFYRVSDVSGPSFNCGGGFSANYGKNNTRSTLGMDTSQEDWMYWEALKWSGVDPQKGLDTMRLFVERHPYVEGESARGLDYTVDFTGQISKTDIPLWIEEFNWLSNVYELDTTARYRTKAIADMAAAEIHFDRNGAANLWYNYSLLYPDPSDVATAWHEIGQIRNHQRLIREDTTPFTIISMPPKRVPFAGVHRSTEDSIRVAIFPNPASREARIFITPNESECVVTLFDILGRKLDLTLARNDDEGHAGRRLDLSIIPAGKYYLRVNTAHGVRTVPLTVDR